MLPTLQEGEKILQKMHRNAVVVGAFSPCREVCFLAAPWRSAWWLGVKLGRGGEGRALPEWLLGGRVLILHLPPSLEPAGSIPWSHRRCPQRWMGQSRPWDSHPTAGRGQTGCLLCQVSATVRPRVAACFFLANTGCPLWTSSFHPFSCAGCTQTQSQNLYFFFPFYSYKILSLILGKICFLPQIYSSSAPVLALWVEDCC